MSNVIDDGFAAYYTEKLWERLPSLYREQDAEGEHPGTLRALIEIWGQQAAVLRRSQDRLWEDTFIDLCDDWAVPYIADLVGTRLISAADPRGRRMDVAKTIYYRRRSGTPRLLEQLIADITGWEGTVVENFRRLARAPHGLDPAPATYAGRFSGTPQGGCADLRSPLGSTMADGPFDEMAHTPDMRRQRGLDGRWNIPKLAFHLFRLSSYGVSGVTPYPRGGSSTTAFTFDPSGRDAQLFMVRRRFADWDTEWHSALPWELPAPMSCRLVNHAIYRIDPLVLQQLGTDGVPVPALNDLQKLRNIVFNSEARFLARIGTLSQAPVLLDPANLVHILTRALLPETGKAGLLPSAVGCKPERTAAETAAANLSAWSGTAPGKTWLLDPERGRFLFLGAAPSPTPTVHYHYGFSDDIGAGPYDRRAGLIDVPTTVAPAGGGAIASAQIPAAGSLEIPDSATYGPIGDRDNIQLTQIQAANLERPYIRLGGVWTLTGGGPDATLTLDGLWLGGRGTPQLTLAGEFASVTLRNLTLDPGGIDCDNLAIPPVPLVITGTVKSLTLDGCILGSISVDGTGHVDELTVVDSILQSNDTTPALALPTGTVHLTRVTIFGAVAVERVWADATLVTATSRSATRRTAAGASAPLSPGAACRTPSSPSTSTTAPGFSRRKSSATPASLS